MTEDTKKLFYNAIVFIVGFMILVSLMVPFFNAEGATENYTGFTEVDPNGRITITSSRISFAGLDTNETTYVYKDEGVDFFSGDFIHLVDFRIDTTSQYSVAGVWAVSNDLRGITYWYNNNKDSIVVFWYGAGTLYLREKDGASVYNDTAVSLSEDATYYLKIKRDEDAGTYGTIYCYIYSNEARTALVDTLSIALHSSKKDYRYIFGLVADDGAGSGQPVTGYFENLDLGLAEPPAPPATTTLATLDSPFFAYFWSIGDYIEILTAGVFSILILICILEYLTFKG
jgi:hypothetical protein